MLCTNNRSRGGRVVVPLVRSSQIRQPLWPNTVQYAVQCTVQHKVQCTVHCALQCSVQFRCGVSRHSGGCNQSASEDQTFQVTLILNHTVTHFFLNPEPGISEDRKKSLSLWATVLNSLQTHGIIDFVVLNMPNNHHAELCKDRIIFHDFY